MFIAWATLTPAANPLQARVTPLLCLVCGDHGGADVGANLLLFVPLAAGLRLAGLSWRRVVLASAVLSLTVELLQYFVIPGRDASLSDVLTNTIGGAAGGAMAPGAVAALGPSPPRAQRLLLAGCAVWLAAMAGSAWLLTPAVLKGRLISNWAEPAAGWDVFTGVVDSVRLNGRAMPPDDLAPDREALRTELTDGTLRLETFFRSGVPRRDQAWIFRLRTPRGGVLTLYQLGRHAGVELPVRAQRFLARPVTATLRNGLPADSGVPVRIRVTAAAGVVRLHSTYQGRSYRSELGISPAYGWRLISPFELGFGAEVEWFSALCLAAGVLPLAYWAARAPRRGRAAATLGLTLLVGLAVVPVLAGFSPVDAYEWAAVALGVAGGWAAQQGAAYLERRCASPSASAFSSS
jgi:hypothetical protein